jgi:hypothetical protein
VVQAWTTDDKISVTNLQACSTRGSPPIQLHLACHLPCRVNSDGLHTIPAGLVPWHPIQQLHPAAAAGIEAVRTANVCGKNTQHCSCADGAYATVGGRMAAPSPTVLCSTRAVQHAAGHRFRRRVQAQVLSRPSSLRVCCTATFTIQLDAESTIV